MATDHGGRRGPLSGLRVLDLTIMLSGPVGSMLLGDLGAEVLKVESPEGDETRRVPPYYYGESSAYFWAINRNKKSIALDLKSPEGRQVFYDLVVQADVVFDNYRPGVLERLRIDYDTLKQWNPRIICCSISTFGHTGPYRDRPGYDLIVQAMSGGMSITGEPDGEPVRAGIPLGDLVGGLMAVHGILAAYVHRQHTGEGQRLEVSLLDVQVYLLSYIAQYYFHSGRIPRPIGSSHQSWVPYQAFQTRDIRIVIVAFLDHHFQKLCKAIGKPEWSGDPRFADRVKRLENKSILIPMLQRHLATRPGDEWLAALHEAGVPAGPINTVDRALADPQVLARKMVVEMAGPAQDPIKTIGNPLKMDKTPVETFTRPPRLGEHTREILAAMPGYSPDRIAALRDRGAIKLAE